MIITATGKGVTRIETGGPLSEIMADAGVLIASVTRILLKEIPAEDHDDLCLDFLNVCRKSIYYAKDHPEGDMEHD